MLKEDQAEAKENKHFFFITSSTFRLSNHCKYVFTQWWRKDEPLVGSRVSRCLSLCSHSIKSGLHRCHSASFVSHCLPVNRHLLFFSWWPLFNLCLTNARRHSGSFMAEMMNRLVGLWMKHFISSPAVCERGVCLCVCADLLCLIIFMAALLFRLKLGPITSEVTTMKGRLRAQDNLTRVIWVDSWGESAFLCYLLRKATIICPADPTEDQQRLITAVNYINVSCLFSLSECRYVKTTEALIVFFVFFSQLLHQLCLV